MNNKTVSSRTPTKYQFLSKGLGSAGLIIDEQTQFVNRFSGWVATFLFSLIPIFGMLAIFLGLLALIISSIGIGIAIKHKHPKSQLITALIITCLGIMLSLMQFSAFG